jgi:hypothetical protein
VDAVILAARSGQQVQLDPGVVATVAGMIADRES